MSKITVLLIASVISFSSFAASSSDKALIDAIEHSVRGKVSLDKSLVLKALGIYLDPQNCSELLSGTAEQALAAAPAWLKQLADYALVKNRTLNEAQRAQLQQVIASKTDSKIKIDYAAKPHVQDRIQETVNASFASANEGSVNAKISILQLVIADQTFAIDLQIAYGNGQKQSLQFKDVPFGSTEKAEGVGQFLVAVVNHRDVLANPRNLRTEVNALRYNAMKLLRVGYPELEGHIQTLVNNLENAFDKKGWFSWFEKDSKANARAFVTLIDVKRQLVGIVRDMKNSHEALQPHLNNAHGQSQTARASEAPRRRGQTARVSAPPSRRQVDHHDDGGTFWHTYFWITDPSFMFTHPWYWGVRDNSPLAPFMIFQGLTDHQRYDQHQASQIFSPIPQNNLQQFSEPVNPVFTTNAQEPVVDAWNARAINQSTIIQPDTNPDTPLSWTNSSGNTVSTSTGSAWDTFRSQDQSPDTTSSSRSSTIQVTPAEENRSQQQQDDGSGWQGGGSVPANDRDPNIRSS